MCAVWWKIMSISCQISHLGYVCSVPIYAHPRIYPKPAQLCNKLPKYMINFANLISKLKLMPYPMGNCFTGWRDRSCQTPEKDVLYIITAGSVRRVHSPGGASYFLFLSRQFDVIASFSYLVLVRPLVS